MNQMNIFSGPSKSMEVEITVPHKTFIELRNLSQSAAYFGTEKITLSEARQYSAFPTGVPRHFSKEFLTLDLSDNTRITVVDEYVRDFSVCTDEDVDYCFYKKHRSIEINNTGKWDASTVSDYKMKVGRIVVGKNVLVSEIKSFDQFCAHHDKGVGEHYLTVSGTVAKLGNNVIYQVLPTIETSSGVKITCLPRVNEFSHYSVGDSVEISGSVSFNSEDGTYTLRPV